jgi:hypothetical protein
MTVAIDVGHYTYIELGTLRLLHPPGTSPLARLLLRLWRSGALGEFAHTVEVHARVARGVCHEITMAFLQAAADAPVRAVWARTPEGWHSWVELGDEAFDVCVTGHVPLVVVQPVDVFRAARGIT